MNHCTQIDDILQQRVRWQLLET